jgi:hypothetical protein
MNATFLSLIWVSGLVIGYAIGRFEIARLQHWRNDENKRIAEDNLRHFHDAYDPEEGHRVNFDRLSDPPPRH